MEEQKIELNEKQKDILERYKKITAKECYKINVVDEKKHPITPISSSIGGIPFLPVGEEWPVDKHGEKMTLFIQLILKGIKLEGYPDNENGIFQIFLSNADDYPTEYKVFYRNYVNQYQKHLKPHISSSGGFLSKPLRIEMTKAKSYLPDYPSGDEVLLPIFNKIMGTSYTLEDELYDIPEYEQITDTLYKERVMANYGGHGDTTQFEEFDYENEAVLVKVDSYLDESIDIGDMGILWCKISKEDLKLGRLENAVVDWDCH